MSVLRLAPDAPDDPAVVSIRADLAQWFRSYADQAERGEITAAAVALVLTDVSDCAWTDWLDGQGNGPALLGVVTVLQHRIAARLGGEE